ncbi:N,N-dimethylformamidase beta subunit family domain-containing protein [Amycolatopsis benzoatilytica]|uniref:N,N-dimethylformamidase beta subunit family domain-containing protein n=1 Tax=Amycolatopsis benzoatilytica TaxID=346045 RepID=UPI000377445F|nr:N,N-dimethylformamidase beta subunit family domain-containing protein [Amycolatopsis benzoatilytica]
MKKRWRSAALVAVLLSASCSAAPEAAPPVSSKAPTAPARPAVQNGTPGWEITHPGPAHAIEGFADRSSVLPGAPVRLFVSTTAAHYTVTAFRMGAYRDSAALQVWKSSSMAGSVQPAAVVQQPTRTVVAPWRPSLDLPTRDWPPGDYLLRLDGDNSSAQFVPLTVRSPSNAGKIVLVNAVTTWQAYNEWGGYSLYTSPNGSKAARSRAVSFDRPYQAQDMQGAGDFLYFELALVRFAENLGVPLGYATDTDLHADPHLLDGARAAITLGHDEYWSAAMRQNTTAARDHGVNLAFLGGNEIYRHIRFAPSAVGPDRVEIDYKSFAEDPYHQTNPLEATPEWRSPPFPRPESVLLGNFYRCNPTRGNLVAANAGNWLLSGIVHNGQSLPGLVGNEYERVDLSVPTPRPIEVLFHSPVTCGGRPDFADTSYYTTPSGSAVFSAGTQYWICALDAGCPEDHADPVAHAAITAITERLLRAYAAGPAGRAHPAQDNLAALGVPGAKPDPQPTQPPDHPAGQ